MPRRRGGWCAPGTVKIKDRGHALTIDDGWRKVADTALEFVQRVVKP